jgi:hypothetical protein
LWKNQRNLEGTFWATASDCGLFWPKAFAGVHSTWVSRVNWKACSNSLVTGDLLKMMLSKMVIARSASERERERERKREKERERENV